MDELELFQFKTYSAALRYFEYGRHISASMYPGELVKHLWKYGGPAKINLRNRIAMHFADNDHGRNGEADWDKARPYDREPWVKFYQFCRGWTHGFSKLTLLHDNGTEEVVEAFKTEYNGRWYEVKAYIENPEFTPFLIAARIKKIEDP